MSIISAVQGIREEIASRLNEIETDNTDSYTNWINMCLTDIAYSFPTAPFIQTSADRTLSSGTRVYANLISDAEKINTITNPAINTKLTFLAPEEFDILQPSATQGGYPTVYTIRGLASNGWFEFYPVPTGSITLHFDYERTIAKVSAGSATLDIPQKYYELPIVFGEKMGLRRKLLYAEAKAVDDEYQVMKQKMMEDLMRQTSQMPRIKSIREFTRNQRNLNDPISNEFFRNN